MADSTKLSALDNSSKVITLQTRQMQYTHMERSAYVTVTIAHATVIFASATAIIATVTPIIKIRCIFYNIIRNKNHEKIENAVQRYYQRSD